MDPIGIVKLWINGLTISRKIECLKAALNSVATAFGIAPARTFDGSFPLGSLLPEAGEEPWSAERAGKAFGNLKVSLEVVRRLLEYRNNLFHGRLKLVLFSAIRRT